MEDFVDPFYSSSTWPEMNGSANSYGRDVKSPTTCVIPSSMENVAAADVNFCDHNGSPSIFNESDLKYGINKSLFPGEKTSHHDLSNCTSHPSWRDDKTHDDVFLLQGMIDRNSTAGLFGSELTTTCSVALHHNTLSKSSSVESSGSERSVFPASFGDAHSIPSVPTLWPPSYSDVSFMGQGKLQSFGFQSPGSGSDITRKTSNGNGRYPQMDNSTVSHDPNELLQDQNELYTSQLPTSTVGQQIQLMTAGFQLHQELPQPPQRNTIKHHPSNYSNNQSHLAPANTGAGNGTVKPRARARRGQATDPHSIAERLRREKIAERMKNLQELVPNSNKTDKASTLDEIIDYVKFLQLQVKVLSMSRLGAAGAVVPLITDNQAEGSGSLLLSSVGQQTSDLSESQDSISFEQEVVKLMESSVTTAMQYLQNKGLCLMPIALASAISNQKGSTSTIPADRLKADASQGIISPSRLSLMERKGRGN